MEQASKKWSVTSKNFFIVVSVTETLAKLISIIALMTAFFAIEDAFDVAAHFAGGEEEKMMAMARHALPEMQSVGMTISVMLALLLVCGFLRHKMLRSVVK